MKRIWKAAAVLAFSFPLTAAEFHIDPGRGSMENDGSREKPWSSLREVVAKDGLFTAGDRLVVAPDGAQHARPRTANYQEPRATCGHVLVLAGDHRGLDAEEREPT